MQRQDILHNSDEEVADNIAKALLLVIELDPDEDLRAAVFTQACQMYASKQILLTEPRPLDLSDLRGNGARR
jgi:hypothetical protein